MSTAARLLVPSVPSLPIQLGDEARLDVTDLHQVDYWTDALGVTEAQLRVAVAEVGVATQDVRDYLGK